MGIDRVGFGVDADTVGKVAPSSAVIALADEITTRRFTVTWDGTDDDGGSGIGTYDIYVSTDGGAYELWLDDTSETSDVFTTDPGTHTYAFYSVATDNVGHEEAAPDPLTADTQTTSTAPQVYFWDEPQWVDLAGDPLPGDPDQFTDVVIRTGTLTVGADLSAFHVTVESGVLVIAPNATLSVMGNFEQLTGTQFTSELDGPSNGLLNITGTATLAGSVNLRATGPLGDLSNDEWGDCTRTIISATGGIAGTFGSEPVAGTHLGYGVFTTDGGTNLQTITYDTNAVLADVFQAAPGDTDGNRKVEGQDILNILQAGLFGDGETPEAVWGNGDFNGDGKVSGEDILMLLETGLFGDGTYGGLLCDPPQEGSVAGGNAAALHDRVLAEPGDHGPGRSRIAPAQAGWIYHYEALKHGRPSKNSRPVKAVDELMASLGF